MKFSIDIQHRRARMIFLIRVEKDEIYLAFPHRDSSRGDTIFLTRAGEEWVGDCDDKSLVKKIGKKIDAAGRLKAKRKRKPA